MLSCAAPKRSQRSVHNPDKSVKYLSNYHPLDEVVNPKKARKKRHAVGKYSQQHNIDHKAPKRKETARRRQETALPVTVPASDDDDDASGGNEGDFIQRKQIEQDAEAGDRPIAYARPANYVPAELPERSTTGLQSAASSTSSTKIGEAVYTSVVHHTPECKAPNVRLWSYTELDFEAYRTQYVRAWNDFAQWITQCKGHIEHLQKAYTSAWLKWDLESQRNHRHDASNSATSRMAYRSSPSPWKCRVATTESLLIDEGQFLGYRKIEQQYGHSPCTRQESNKIINETLDSFIYRTDNEVSQYNRAMELRGHHSVIRRYGQDLPTYLRGVQVIDQKQHPCQKELLSQSNDDLYRDNASSSGSLSDGSSDDSPCSHSISQKRPRLPSVEIQMTTPLPKKRRLHDPLFESSNRRKSNSLQPTSIASLVSGINSQDQQHSTVAVPVLAKLANDHASNDSDNDNDPSDDEPNAAPRKRCRRGDVKLSDVLSRVQGVSGNRRKQRRR